MTKPELAVRSVPVQDLRLDPGNARRHGRRNLDAIKGSLSSFGQRRPLVVLPDLTVIAGNGTLEAMRELGWTEVAVTVVPEDWSADQARAYALADNRTAELAEWDDADDLLARLAASMRHEAAAVACALVAMVPAAREIVSRALEAGVALPYSGGAVKADYRGGLSFAKAVTRRRLFAETMPS